MWVCGACLFCLGAWVLQQQAGLPGLPWLVVLGGALLVRWTAPGGLGRWRTMVDLLLCLAAGFIWAAWVAQGRLAAQLPHAWEGRDIRVEGVVAQMPQGDAGSARFGFDIERVLTPLAPGLDHVQLHWYRPATVVRAGERWALTLRLKRPHGTLNPYGFDRKLWYLERGIQAVGQVDAKVPARRLDGLVWRPAYVVERARQGLRERVGQAVGGTPAAGVLVALAVGDQDAIAADQWRLFTRTGVGHLMSISGLHITMLSSLAAWFFGLLWRRSPRLCAKLPARKAALCAGLAIGLVYAALSGFGVPAQRTVLMLSVLVLALLWGRQWSAASVLASALWVVTAVDPFSVMAPGFWLSFGAVALILYVSLGRLRPPSSVVQWLRTQWALSLGLVPLSLLLFQQVSVISPLANAFAIPLVSLLVVPLTLAGMLLPGDGLLWLAEKLMGSCLWLLGALDRGDWVTWQQAAPPTWTLALAVLGVLWSLAPRGFPGRGVALLALLPVGMALPPAPKAGEYWMDVLDVGQGLAVLIRTQHRNLLYDAGPAYGSESDAGERIVLPHLRASGARRLDGMVVSHDDQDHTGGAAAVLAGIEVRWMASSLPAGHALNQAAPRVLRCAAGQQWVWDDVRFEFLHPGTSGQAAGRSKDNDRSCVLRVAAAGGITLLPGDIEARVESHLVRYLPTRLRADVLLAPHHGSRTSSTAAFLQAVRPGTVIVTNGYRNRHGHPRPEVLARYQQVGARVWRSDRDGAVRLLASAEGVRIESWRDAHRRYWYD